VITNPSTFQGATHSVVLAGCAMFACFSCASVDDGPDRPMAKAYDQVLTWTDLRQVIPLEASATDSAAMADQFIEAWLKQQAILHMAELNQPTERLDMEAQLEDYRRSLVIFNYEQALVDQKLDTSVSQAEMERYYTEHQANFELKETIARVRWFKVSEPDKRVLRKMEDRFLHGNVEDLHELELWLARSGVSIMDRSMNWTPASVLLADMALPEGDGATVLGQVGKRVLRSEHAAWFVEVLEQRAQNSVSPLEMVRADIRAILLNQRKIQLIEDMRSSVYAQALENKHVERYHP